MSLTIERRPLADLHEDPNNARTHPARNIEAIRASYERFGQRAPLIIRPDGTVVSGNGQLAVIREMGWTEADVVVFEGTDDEAKALAIAMNRSADLASWDDDVLRATLQSLDRDLARAAGFVDADLTRLGVGSTGGAMDAPAPPTPLNPASRRGDIWLLGDHRLLCGDSSLDADVDRVLAGAQIHLVNTDPPYNVKVEPRSNNAIAAGLSSFTTTHHQGLDLARHPEKSKPTGQMRAKDRPLANDFVSDEEFARLLRAWFGNLARVLIPGRAFYIWGGYDNVGRASILYGPSLRDAQLYFAQAIIWVKEHPVLTRKDFMGNHEWCFYGWKEGAAHRWLGPTNATDTWIVKKVNPQSMVHLTEKPVELAVMAMEYSSRPGENVLDLFGGSGSTLMGAQQCGRRAHLIEMDEAYCDVIVTRWQNATGKEATLDGDGRPFAAVSAERLAATPAPT